MEVYVNSKGERIFAALQNYGYDENGLPLATGGKLPVYSKNGNTLTCQTFQKNGKLLADPITVHLTEYRLELCPDDDVVTLHIHEGGKLTMDDIKESLVRAREVFGKYFPTYKSFVCRTWFLEPALRGEVIKDTSNMAMYADMFDVICEEDQNNHSVFEHVFKVAHQPLENLTPKNDFQKRVLDRALRGEKIYWTYGVLKNDFEY